MKLNELSPQFKKLPMRHFDFYARPLGRILLFATRDALTGVSLFPHRPRNAKGPHDGGPL